MYGAKTRNKHRWRCMFGTSPARLERIDIERAQESSNGEAAAEPQQPKLIAHSCRTSPAHNTMPKNSVTTSEPAPHMLTGLHKQLRLPVPPHRKVATTTSPREKKHEDSVRGFSDTNGTRKGKNKTNQQNSYDASGPMTLGSRAEYSPICAISWRVFPSASRALI